MKKPFKIWGNVFAIGGSEILDISDASVYLVGSPEGVVLIDSGAGGSFSRLVENIKILGFDPEMISTVIATHAHIDHIGALSRFREEYGARVIAHELDSDAIESGKGVF